MNHMRETPKNLNLFYNQPWCQLLQYHRERRRISQKELSDGIISRSGLGKIENGDSGWSKLVGDVLMMRMGIWTEFFEMSATDKELEYWRLRENICFHMFDQKELAKKELENYQQHKLKSIELQFVLKMQSILSILNGDDIRTSLEYAEQAVSCTIKQPWLNKLDTLLVSPPELETMLLLAYLYDKDGDGSLAWKIINEIWRYPSRQHWDHHMEALILPQTAIVALHVNKGHEQKSASEMGKYAIELLRHDGLHQNLYLLLEAMMKYASYEDHTYMKQIKKFYNGFQDLYHEANLPKKRLWQTIHYENTHGIGTMLWMLRKAVQKSQSEAIMDENGEIIDIRHLNRLESGENGPSFEHFLRLSRNYGKNRVDNRALLNTKQLEILQIRQSIARDIYYERYDQAEIDFDNLRVLLQNSDDLGDRQQVLFFETLLNKKLCKISLDTCLSSYMKALHLTVPKFETMKPEWWVFQREEIMIVSNIAMIYSKMNQLDKAHQILKTLLHSLEVQNQKSGISYIGYDIVIRAFTNNLGNMGFHKQAIDADKLGINKLLKTSGLFSIDGLLYDIAWNSYEIRNEKAAGDYNVENCWTRYYKLSCLLAEFIYDIKNKQFLDERRDKYI